MTDCPIQAQHLDELQNHPHKPHTEKVMMVIKKILSEKICSAVFIQFIKNLRSDLKWGGHPH